MRTSIDLGHGRSYRVASWSPKVPEHRHLEPVAAAGIILECEHGEARIAFHISPEHDLVIAGPKFTLIQLDPLSLGQSVEGPCGCNGFIIQGKWVPN